MTATLVRITLQMRGMTGQAINGHNSLWLKVLALGALGPYSIGTITGLDGMDLVEVWCPLQ